LNSAIYTGTVRHRRFSPKQHDFSYPIYMLAIDLDELPELEACSRLFSASKRALLRLKRSDYLHDKTTPLKQAVINIVEKLGGPANIDKVTMVCQARCLGLYFSPVNFYFCHTGDSISHMLAEVNNTPWGEKHCYLVPLASNGYSHDKAFHVSPFMDLDMQYRWFVKSPSQHLSVHIENWRDEKLFDATMTLERREWSHSNLRKTLWQWPAMSFSIMKGIYWQALKLFIKAIPFVPHPGR